MKTNLLIRLRPFQKDVKYKSLTISNQFECQMNLLSQLFAPFRHKSNSIGC